MPLEWKPYLYDAGSHRRALVGLFHAGIAKRLYPQALCRIGADIAQVSSHDADLVLRLSNALIEYAPDSASAWIFRSQALRLAKQSERAMLACDKALSLDPSHLESLVMKGKLLLQKGDYEEAETHLRGLHSTAPKLATGLLCECLVRLAKFAEARAIISDYRVRHGPDVALSALECALCILGGDTDRLAELQDPVLISISQSDLCELNEELAVCLGPDSAMVAEPESTTTVKGRQAFLNDLLPKPLLSKVVDEIRQRIGIYVEEHAGHPYLDNLPAMLNLNAWAVNLDQQGYQDPHCHPGGWLSGVYYVEVAGSPDEHDDAGAIEFWQPPEELVGNAEAETAIIQPRNGMMLVFPSYFYHRTIPHRGDGNRISIAFDVG